MLVYPEFFFWNDMLLWWWRWWRCFMYFSLVVSSYHCDQSSSLRSHPHTPGRYPGRFINSLWRNFLRCGGLGKFGVSSQGMWAKSLIFFFMFLILPYVSLIYCCLNGRRHYHRIPKLHLKHFSETPLFCFFLKLAHAKHQTTDLSPSFTYNLWMKPPFPTITPEICSKQRQVLPKQIRGTI